MRLKAILEGVAIRMERIEAAVPARCECRGGFATVNAAGQIVCEACGGAVDFENVQFPAGVLPRAPEVDPLDELMAMGGKT